MISCISSGAHFLVKNHVLFLKSDAITYLSKLKANLILNKRYGDIKPQLSLSMPIRFYFLFKHARREIFRC